VKVLTPGFYARADTKTPVKFATISVGVNLVGNLVLIPTLGRVGFGHIGPPLATALASCLNTFMLYRELRRRGHFHADSRLKRRIPRLVLAALIMGAALFVLAPMAWPYLTGSIVRRAIALIVLTGGGAAVYGAACFLTGAFRVSDLRALLTRRVATAKKD
jgi:putative peptidoglycan lipid II flippase